MVRRCIPWAKAEEDFLRKHYPTHKAQGTTKMFNRRFQPRTVKSIINKAVLLNLSHEARPGYYSVPELSLLSGTSTKNIRAHISNGNIKAQKTGGYWFIPNEEAERVIEKYSPKIPWDEIRVTEAVRRLGYEAHDSMSSRIRETNFIPSVRRGSRIFIPLAYVEAAEEQMRRTGGVRVRWKKIHEELRYESRN